MKTFIVNRQNCLKLEYIVFIFLFFVLQEYERIMQTFTDHYKLEVLQLATMAHNNVFTLMCKLYGLDKPGNESLASHINVMLARHQYKEVKAHVNIFLQLFLISQYHLSSLYQMLDPTTL